MFAFCGIEQIFFMMLHLMMQYVFVFFLYFEHALDEINADLSSGVAS